MELEKLALSDEYFIKRNLYPNVDFYSGIVLRALGIPVSMYTVLFAVARTVGWVAQWKEMVSAADNKITRPRQVGVWGVWVCGVGSIPCVRVCAHVCVCVCVRTHGFALCTCNPSTPTHTHVHRCTWATWSAPLCQLHVAMGMTTAMRMRR